MLLAKNKEFLMRRHPRVWSIIQKNNIDMDCNLSCFLEETKNNMVTLKVKLDGKETYLHSKYNPLHEAKNVIKSYCEKASKHGHVIFYGIGLGYHIDEFLDRYTDIKFTFYEPIPEIFNYYLSLRDLSDLPLERLGNIFLEDTLQDRIYFLNYYKKIADDNPLFVILPSYESIFADKYRDFSSSLSKEFLSWRFNLGTSLLFQKSWIINSMKNLIPILQAPNVLVEKNNFIFNKPVVMVAAGPSLEDEIENLRYIKDKGIAYIFSVGSALKPLLKNGIYPDATCCVEPGDDRYTVYKEVLENRIDSIPLLFSSDVCYELIDEYLGPKLSFFSKFDQISPFYLSLPDSKQVESVSPGGSVAIMTLELLARLGANPIILVGQNLAFRGNQYYASHIEYYQTYADNEKLKGQPIVEDVYGQKIYTTKQFILYREQMEKRIEFCSSSKVLNSTKGGAKIQGTTFKPLEDIIRELPKEKVVDDDWFNIISTKYDKDYMKKQIKTMDYDYKIVLDIFKELDNILEKIRKALKQQDKNKIQKHFPKIGKNIRKLEKNKFFLLILQPLNRISYDLLIQAIAKLADWGEDFFSIVESVVKEYEKFICDYKKEFELIKPIFDEMDQELNKFINANT